MMPKNLVFIRHGESELNLINRELKKSKKAFPKELEMIPDREYRLSKKGVEQAEATGQWLAQNFDKFDVIVCSDHVRAKETCAIICKFANWTDAEVICDPLISERNWGFFHLVSVEKREELLSLKKRDPFNFPMPDGETLLQARNRSKSFLDRSSRQWSDLNVLVVSHGEFIESIWSEIGKFRTETQIEFFSSPEGDIKNCQVIHFRSNHGKIDEVKSSNPYLKEFGSFKKINKEKLTVSKLFEEVNLYPHQIKDED